MTVADATRPALQAPKLWPLSVEAYHALGEAGLIPKNTELLYGQVFQKMSKSPLHSFLHSVLTEALLAALPAGTCLRSEQPIACAGSEPEPDLAVVKGRKEDFRRAHPTTAELVIEICVSSYDYDRSKLPAYANAGVNEVWLVLEPVRQIEIHRKPIGGRYTERETRGPDGTVASRVLPYFEVSLDALFE